MRLSDLDPAGRVLNLALYIHLFAKGLKNEKGLSGDSGTLPVFGHGRNGNLRGQYRWRVGVCRTHVRRLPNRFCWCCSRGHFDRLRHLVRDVHGRALARHDQRQASASRADPRIASVFRKNSFSKEGKSCKRLRMCWVGFSCWGLVTMLGIGFMKSKIQRKCQFCNNRIRRRIIKRSNSLSRPKR